MENRIYEKLITCTNAVKSRISFKPEVALILGSGLGDYAKEMDVVEVLEYSEIEGFPVSTVTGHQGRFLFGYVQGVPIVAMQGRVHYYEGYEMSDVVLPTRLMGLLGAKTIIITTAVPSPLIGQNLEELGPRFPDMSEVYKKELREIIKKAARNMQVSIQQGVFMQFTGPNYETPAEIRMCRAMGGDAAGMSTACEAMAANHMGMDVCGISCITNMASGMSAQPLDHKEVQETADRAAADFKKLVTETIRLIGERKNG